MAVGAQDATSRPRRPSRSYLSPLLVALYFLAGVGTLVFEVVWIRLFGLVLGDTVQSLGAVLAAFFAGIALGSSLLGRWADKRRRLLEPFILLQMIVAVTGVLVPAAITALGNVYGSAFASLVGEPELNALARFGVAFLVILIPSAAIGATLPLLSRYGARQAALVGRGAGLLYGANTAGAVVGTLAAGLYLIEAIGVQGALFVAAALHVIAALLAIVEAKRLGDQALLPDSPHGMGDAVPLDPGEPLPRAAVSRMVLVVFALTGLTALAYEVVWTRLLVYAIDTTTYALTMILTSVLLGFALGSLLFAPAAGGARPRVLPLALLQGATGVTALAALLFLLHSDPVNGPVARLIGHADPWRWNLNRFVHAAFLALVPSFFLGASFPFAARLAGRGYHRIGGDVGALLALSALGSAVGGALAALVLVPALGAVPTLVVLALVNAAAAVLLLTVSEGGRPLRLVTGVAFVLLVLVGRGLLPADPVSRLVAAKEPDAKILDLSEAPGGTVAVTEYPSFRLLTVDGVTVAGTDLVHHTIQKILGHVPALVHPHPRSVLEIGVGSGETARALLVDGVEHIDAVEICPEVIDASRYLDPSLPELLQDPRIRLYHTDGRTFARRTDRTYDLVVNDVGHPALGNNAPLFSREHFEACRARLAPDGLMASWLPLYGIKAEELRMIVGTFLNVFPHATLWMPNNGPVRHALLLGGAKDSPLKIDIAQLADRIHTEAIATDLAAINVRSLPDLLDYFLMDENALARFAAWAPLNTDLNPLLEFRAPQVYTRDAELLATNLELLAGQRTSVFPYLTNFAAAGTDSAETAGVVERYFEGTGYLLHGLAMEIRGVSGEPERAYRAALEANPEDRDAAYLLQEKVVRETRLAEAVAQNPQDKETRLRLARLLLSQGKFQESLDELQALVKDGMDDSSIRYDMGVCQARLGALDDAASSYQKAIELDPTIPEPHVNLGALYQRQGRFDEAVKEYKAALALKPNHPEANYNMGVAFAQRGLHEDAIPYFQAAVRERPTYAEAFYNLGISLAMTGKLPEAIDAWEKTIALTPGNQQARENIAKARQMLQQGGSPGSGTPTTGG